MSDKKQTPDKTIHVDFRKKRTLTEVEIEDKIADESGILQDPVIRMARSIERYRNMLNQGKDNDNNSR